VRNVCAFTSGLRCFKSNAFTINLRADFGVVSVPLAYQLLMMRMLPWQPWAQLSQYGELVAPVGEARDALRSVHPEVQRLAALLARVKDSHFQPPW
jgi:hypothetical protein